AFRCDRGGLAGSGSQTPADVPSEAPALAPRHHGGRREPNSAQQRNLRSNAEEMLLGAVEPFDELGKECERTRRGAQRLRSTPQISKAELAAVQSVVNASVDIAPDQTTARNGQHAEERHVAVRGAEPEVGVIQDAQWPEHSENHVKAEPACGGT